MNYVTQIDVLLWMMSAKLLPSMNFVCAPHNIYEHWRRWRCSENLSCFVCVARNLIRNERRIFTNLNLFKVCLNIGFSTFILTYQSMDWHFHVVIRAPSPNSPLPSIWVRWMCRSGPLSTWLNHPEMTNEYDVTDIQWGDEDDVFHGIHCHTGHLYAYEEWPLPKFQKKLFLLFVLFLSIWFREECTHHAMRTEEKIFLLQIRISISQSAQRMG